MQTGFSQLSDHLYIHHGHVNTGILRDGNKALLIDPSGTTLQTTLAALRITEIEQVLFTHHHRDNTSGFSIPDNARVGVPAKEAAWFREVETFGTTRSTDGISTTTTHIISCSPTLSV